MACKGRRLFDSRGRECVSLLSLCHGAALQGISWGLEPIPRRNTASAILEWHQNDCLTIRTMKRTHQVTAIIEREDDAYVALCPNWISRAKARPWNPLGRI